MLNPRNLYGKRIVVNLSDVLAGDLYHRIPTSIPSTGP
jgi:hypothetical protein